MKTIWTSRFSTQLSILGLVLTATLLGSTVAWAAATPTPAPSPKSAAQAVADVVAQNPKSSVDQITRDFLIACEMSKVSVNLAKTPAFKEDPADLNYRIAELMSGAFRTYEVKELYKTIVTAKPDDRVGLWHQAAKDNGVKNFKCKTIGFK